MFATGQECICTGPVDGYVVVLSQKWIRKYATHFFVRFTNCFVGVVWVNRGLAFYLRDISYRGKHWPWCFLFKCRSIPNRSRDSGLDHVSCILCSFKYIMTTMCLSCGNFPQIVLHHAVALVKQQTVLSSSPVCFFLTLLWHQHQMSAGIFHCDRP